MFQLSWWQEEQRKQLSFFFQIQYNFPIGLFFNSRTGQRLFVDFLSFTFGTAKRGKCFSNTTKFLFKCFHNSTLPFNCFIWVSGEDYGNGVQKKSCHSFRIYFIKFIIFCKQRIKLNLGNSKHLFQYDIYFIFCYIYVSTYKFISNNGLRAPDIVT